MYVYHPPITVGFAAIVIGFLRRTPFIYDICDLWPDSVAVSGMMSHPVALSLLGKLCSYVYRRAQHVTVVSPGFKKTLVMRGVPHLDQKMIFRHSVPQRGWYSGICREARPIVHCRSNVCQGILWFAHAEAVGNFKQINARDVLKFPIYTHQVLVGPLAVRIVGVRHVVGRSQLPGVTLFQ